MLKNNKYKVLLIALLILLSNEYSFAQEEEKACSVVLKQAEAMYDGGKIESVPIILQKCIEHGFSKELKLRAYKLIITSYLFDDKKEKAKEYMLKFLKLNPEYELNRAIESTEFIQLYDLYRTLPIYSVGFIGGGNLSNTSITESYGVHNISNTDINLRPNGFGYHFGISINKYITKKIEINIQPMIVYNTFSYTDSIFDFTYVEIDEDQIRFDIPISITYEFGKKRVRPYIRAGFSAGYIISSYSKANRIYSNNAHPNISGTDIDLLNCRRSFNFSSLYGLGIKYKITRGFIFFDARYDFGVLNQVVTSKRYSNPELIYKYYYVDNNFKLNNIMLSVGYIYSIYKPKIKNNIIKTSIL